MEGFEEEERAAGIAGQLPQEGDGTLDREDACNERCFGGRQEPDKFAMS